MSDETETPWEPTNYLRWSVDKVLQQKWQRATTAGTGWLGWLFPRRAVEEVWQDVPVEAKFKVL